MRLNASSFLVSTLAVVCLILPVSPSRAVSGALQSNLMNPLISLNVLFLGDLSVDGSKASIHRHVEEGGFLHEHEQSGVPYGFGLQEAELAISSTVDPYWKLDGKIVFADGEAAVEEAYAVNTSLPKVTVKLGKMKAAFGKHGLLHLHAFPFVQAPLVMENTVGGEGYIDGGVEAAYLTPLPFFSELTLGGFTGTGAAHSHDAEGHSHAGAINLAGPRRDDFSYLVHWKNFFEIGKNGGLEIGASGLAGRGSDGLIHGAYAVDLAFKNTPARSDGGRGFIFQNEWVRKFTRLPDGDGLRAEQEGGYSSLQFRMSRRWWLGVRAERVIRVEVESYGPLDADGDGNQDFDDLNFDTVQDAGEESLWEPLDLPGDARRVAVNLAWAPSEFSSIRAEYSYGSLESADGRELDRRFLLQFNQTIGSHPAHAF